MADPLVLTDRNRADIRARWTAIANDNARLTDQRGPYPVVAGGQTITVTAEQNRTIAAIIADGGNLRRRDRDTTIPADMTAYMNRVMDRATAVGTTTPTLDAAMAAVNAELVTEVRRVEGAIAAKPAVAAVAAAPGRPAVEGRPAVAAKPARDAALNLRLDALAPAAAPAAALPAGLRELSTLLDGISRNGGLRQTEVAEVNSGRPARVGGTDAAPETQVIRFTKAQADEIKSLITANALIKRADRTFTGPTTMTEFVQQVNAARPEDGAWNTTMTAEFARMREASNTALTAIPAARRPTVTLPPATLSELPASMTSAPIGMERAIAMAADPSSVPLGGASANPNAALPTTAAALAARESGGRGGNA